EKLRASVEELTRFITDAESLRKKAEDRYRNVKQEREQVVAEIDSLQKQTKALERQVELAHRVTQRGTLVSLARESLDRESRWIEAMFRSEVSQGGDDFADALRHGNEVMSLRDGIAREREKIFQLRTLQERRLSGSEVNS